MFKVENAINTLSCFDEKKFISVEELARYIKYICLDNYSYIGDLEVNINFGIGNSCKASYELSEGVIDLNYSEIVLEFAENILNKRKNKMPFVYHLKKNKTPDDLINLYSLSDSEIALCNLKIIEGLNHELFHVLTFNSILNRANDKEQPFSDSVLHYLALSSMNQMMDCCLDDRLYTKNHDLFYEEFLAITHSYNWTFNIIDKIDLSKEDIKLYNKETYNRLCKVFSELKSSEYINYNYTKEGVIGSKSKSVSVFTDNYQSFLIPRCKDILSYPLKAQRKILKNEIKDEKSYLRNLNDFSIKVYALDKLVYNNTSKASFDDESLLYGNVSIDSDMACLFNGTLDNDILSYNMLKYVSNEKKAKVKDF